MTFKNKPHDNLDTRLSIEAAFATDYSKSSKLEIITLLRVNIERTAIVLPNANAKGKKVCKLGLAAELFVVVEGRVAEYRIAQQLRKLVERKLGQTIYTNSCSLY